MIPLFIVFGLIFGRYNFLLPKLPNALLLSRNFITMGIPCFGIGWILKQHKDKVLASMSMPAMYVGIFFLLSIVEILLLTKYNSFGTYSGDYLIFTIPFAASLVTYCLYFHNQGKGSPADYIGYHYSSDIYIYHVFVGQTLYKISTHYIYISYIILPLLIYALTMLFAYVWRTTSIKTYNIQPVG